ncbi:MAG: glycosyltransferase family 4 protein [Chloroflexi bacterium]|nr:glycosyltransferase family 4 protein [Chloroflexota bacterium]
MSGRILIIVQNLPVPFDRRVWLEAVALREAGYTVSVISPAGPEPPGRRVLDGVYLVRYPSPPEAHSLAGYLFEFVYCWICTLVLSLVVYVSRGFDAIHACNPPETYFLLALLYRPLGVRFLFDHHDLSPEMYLAKGGHPDGWLFRGLRFLERLTFRTADVVIATNESHKRIAMERGQVPEADIFVVRSGPDSDRLRLLPPDLSLKEGRQYLLCYLGEMCPQDRVDIVLQAMHHLAHNLGRTDLLCVLMGGGSQLARLRDMNREMNLANWVRFLGRVSDDLLCRYLSTADVCLAPDPLTAWADQSTMNKVVEYMFFGKPVVAFDLKETRVSAQDAALYATPNDPHDFANKINTLLSAPERRQEMGQIARRRVQDQLGWEHSVPHLLKAYQRLL